MLEAKNLPPALLTVRPCCAITTTIRPDGDPFLKRKDSPSCLGDGAAVFKLFHLFFLLVVSFLKSLHVSFIFHNCPPGRFCPFCSVLFLLFSLIFFAQKKLPKNLKEVFALHALKNKFVVAYPYSKSVSEEKRVDT